MDQTMTITAGMPELDVTTVADIRNLVATSILIERGHWWFNPEFGSRLHELRREKATPRTLRLAREYAQSALQWLKESGKASAIVVETWWEGGLVQRRLGVQVTVTQANGVTVTFNQFVEVV